MKNHSKSQVLHIKITLLVASSFTVMAGATIAPAQPGMEAAFSRVPNIDFLVRLVLTLPAIFIALGAFIAGALIDRFGRKTPMLIGLLLYGLSGTSGLYLITVEQILIGRALLGVSVAAIMTTSTTLIADYFFGDERNRFMGLQAACMGFGGVFFLIGGGALADISWRAPFIVYAAAFLLFPLALSSIFEPEGAGERNKSGEETELSLDVILLLAFIGALCFIIMMIFYSIPVQLPHYLKNMGVKKNILTGVALASMTLVSSIFSLFYQVAKRRLDFISIYIILFALLGLGYFLLAQARTYLEVIPALLIAGAGLGFFMPNTSVLAVSRVPERFRGRAVGVVTSFIFLGQFASPFPHLLWGDKLSIEQGYLISAYVLGACFLLFILIQIVNLFRHRTGNQ